MLDLQTLVSRETNPLDPAVVTVGSIHGGSKHNIIPNEVQLQLTVRSTKDSVRKHLLDGIERIAKAAAKGAGAPAPEVKIDREEFTPALLNDPKLTQKTVALFKDVLGADKVRDASADHGRRGLQPLRPRQGCRSSCIWLGTIDPERVAESRRRERQTAAVAALGSVRPGAGADHQDRRADDEPGGAESDAEAVNGPQMRAGQGRNPIQRIPFLGAD